MAGLTSCWTSSCDVCLPCPCADILTDDREPRIAISLPRDPELRRRYGFRQMQKLGTAPEIQEHPDLPHLGLLDDFEDQRTFGRMAPHDGDKDDPL